MTKQPASTSSYHKDAPGSSSGRHPRRRLDPPPGPSSSAPAQQILIIMGSDTLGEITSIPWTSVHDNTWKLFCGKSLQIKNTANDTAGPVWPRSKKEFMHWIEDETNIPKFKKFRDGLHRSDDGFTIIPVWLYVFSTACVDLNIQLEVIHPSNIVDAYRRKSLAKALQEYDKVWMCDPEEFLRYDTKKGYEPLTNPEELDDLMSTSGLQEKMIPSRDVYNTTFQKHLRHRMLNELHIDTVPTQICDDSFPDKDALAAAIQGWARLPETITAVATFQSKGFEIVPNAFIVKSAIGYGTEGNTIVSIDGTVDTRYNKDNLHRVVGKKWPSVVQHLLASNSFKEYKVGMPSGCDGDIETFVIQEINSAADEEDVSLDNATDFCIPAKYDAFRNFAKNAAQKMSANLSHVDKFIRIDVFVATQTTHEKPFAVNEFDTINSAHTYMIGVTLVDIVNMFHSDDIMEAFMEETGKLSRKDEYERIVAPALKRLVAGITQILDE